MARSEAFRRSDADALLRLAGEVAELPPGLATRGEHALGVLARLVGAKLSLSAAFRLGPDGCPASMDYGRMHGVGIEPAAVEAVNTDFVTGQPVAPMRDAMLTGAPIVTLRREQAIRDRDWYGGRYYNEVSRPSNADHNVHSIATRPGLVTGLAVARAVGDRPFTARDAAIVQMFHVHIDPALHRRPAPPIAVSPRLPPRLRPVLDRLLAGDAEKQVALRLGLSPHTVHQYVKAIYKALGVNSRPELLARCLGGGHVV